MPTATEPALERARIYLLVPNADAIITFIQSAFDGELLGRYADPSGRVMHAALRVGDSVIEMGEPPNGEAVPMSVHLYVDDADATFDHAVRAGGTVLRPLVDQFYGDREATVLDPAGNHWYIATHKATGSKPPGFSTITPFIHVRGVDRLIDFMKSALGAEEVDRFTTPDGLIAHAVMNVAGSLVEMGEGAGEWKPKPTHLHLFVRDADSLFARAIAAGATELYPMTDQPYGERGGGVADPFGNHWYIATPK